MTKSYCEARRHNPEPATTPSHVGGSCTVQLSHRDQELLANELMADKVEPPTPHVLQALREYTERVASK